MPLFKYEVQETAGSISSGTIEAGSATDASMRLRAEGQNVLNVTPLGADGPAFMDKLRSVRVEFGPGLKDVMNFTTQLAVMIKAGINIRHAIEGVADQADNQRFRAILLEIKDDVEGGKPFSEALAKHPKVFSPLYVNMVRASELGGNFGHMLERISKYLRDQAETRSMVRGAMIYPIIIAVMAVVTTVFLLTFVLPRFTKIFAGKEALLPKPTKVLMATSAFMRERWYVLIGGLVALGVGIRSFIGTPGGRVHWDKFKLKVPLFKKMLRALYITRGLHTMGELVNAGVPMLETLRITAEVSGNKVYEKIWLDVYHAVESGEKIATPLLQQKVLPRNVVTMISSGEESGKLGEVLAEVSEFYERELKNTIKAVTSMIEPLMIVIMGVVVGFIAMSIILPIFKMSSLVK